MRQRLRLDRAAFAVYLGGALGTLACTPRSPAGVVPVGAAPVAVEQVRGWVAPTLPTGHQLHRFSWRFRDELSSAGGRGSVRIAPPDSLRFDVAGPLGAGKASAVVVHDSAVWVAPPDALEKMVPSYPLMWAMFGVARPPAEGEQVTGLVNGDVTAWRYARGADTTDYARTTGDPVRFVAEVRRGGKVVGRAESRTRPDGTPISARLTVPSRPARLDLTFTKSTLPSAFEPEVWSPPQP
jgi:hypothetical protein